MSDVNYYLKKPVKGKSLIFMQFKYHGNILKFSLKQTVEPSNWNKRKQRLKTNSSFTSNGKHLVNDFIFQLTRSAKRIVARIIRLPDRLARKIYLILVPPSVCPLHISLASI